jgi:hypothetical protein
MGPTREASPRTYHRPMASPRLLAAILLAVAAAASPPAAAGSPPPEAAPPAIPADASVDELVAMLDDPSFPRREAASEQLLSMPGIAPELVERLAAADLPPERRHRLISIVATQVERTPRGALGIRMEPMRELGRGVVVSGFVEGMPAAAVLRLGDRIVEIEGAAIGGSSDLIELVQRRLPGEAIRLGVVREGAGEEPIEVRLVLGSVEQLQQDPGDPLLRQNPVLRERAQQVAELRQRFGGVPLRVAIAPPPAADEPLHPEVLRARLYFDLIAEGAVVDPEPIRERLRQRLQRLRRDAVDPRLPEEERLRLREAIVRIEAMFAPKPEAPLSR